MQTSEAAQSSASLKHRSALLTKTLAKMEDKKKQIKAKLNELQHEHKKAKKQSKKSLKK